MKIYKIFEKLYENMPYLLAMKKKSDWLHCHMRSLEDLRDQKNYQSSEEKKLKKKQDLVFFILKKRMLSFLLSATQPEKNLWTLSLYNKKIYMDLQVPSTNWFSDIYWSIDQKELLEDKKKIYQSSEEKKLKRSKT